MMPDEQDPLLHTLFAEARHDLDGAEFIDGVMAQTRFLRFRAMAAWIGLALVLAAGAWYFALPVQVAQLLAEVLATTLIDLGDSWLAWLFFPVNNLAALLVLSVKAIRMGRKKIIHASYAN